MNIPGRIFEFLPCVARRILRAVSRVQLKKRPTVALLIEPASGYGRGLYRGILEYVREHGPWTICLGEYRGGKIVPEELAKGQCDGVIARIDSSCLARLVHAAGIPVVDVSCHRFLPATPCVETDDAAISQLAAAHLLERGFRHFGFVGDDRLNWSRLRALEFKRIVSAAGHDCAIYQPDSRRQFPASWNLDRRKLGEWVKRLPKPAGIMAGWDGFGRQLLEACRHSGVSVPDEVAVIGVDNDELECEFSNPPLSTVRIDSERAGYEAAALLDRMLKGESNCSTLRLIGPRGIVSRQSTDALAIEDSRVAAAVRFIREHACDGIQVADVLRAVPLSRRELETRFRRHLERSPHQEIQRARLQRVKLLLTETDLTLAAIAERTGFEHPEYLSVIFKRNQKCTLRAYRLQFRK